MGDPVPMALCLPAELLEHPRRARVPEGPQLSAPGPRESPSASHAATSASARCSVRAPYHHRNDQAHRVDPGPHGVRRLRASGIIDVAPTSLQRCAARRRASQAERARSDGPTRTTRHRPCCGRGATVVPLMTNPAKRERAALDVLALLPEWWAVGPTSYDSGIGRWTYAARGPHPGRGKYPVTITGTGEDELAAMVDLRSGWMSADGQAHRNRPARPRRIRRRGRGSVQAAEGRR